MFDPATSLVEEANNKIALEGAIAEPAGSCGNGPPSAVGGALLKAQRSLISKRFLGVAGLTVRRSCAPAESIHPEKGKNMAGKDGASTAGRKHPEPMAAHFDIRSEAIVVQRLVISDPELIKQARIYARGSNELQKADLTEFLQDVAAIGARTMAIIKRDHEADLYVDTITSVTDGSLRLLTNSLDELNKAAASAGEKLGKSSAAALRSLNSTRKSLYDELQALLAGDDPGILAVLEHVINKRMDGIERKLTKLQTDTETVIWALIEDSADPDNPKSPTAKLMAEFSRLDVEFRHVRKLLTDVLSEFNAARAAEAAASETTNRSTLKGTKYEDQLAQLLTQIASGMGGEYQVTRSKRGTLNSTKGDGVLLLDGGDIRVVIEMMDSDKKVRDWNGYMDEAERNRQATVSVGLVRSRSQNANEVFRTIGGSRTRRFVVAFDPMRDDPTLLRTTALLALWSAVALGDRTAPSDASRARATVAAAVSDLKQLNKCVEESRAIQSAARRIEDRITEALTSVGSKLKAALDSLKT